MSAEEREIPSSKADARSFGTKTYFTGKPCRNGEIAERYTSSGSCLCLHCRETERQNSKKWKEKNREKLLSSRRRRYAENRDDVLKYQRQWRSSNRDRALAGQARYREENREAIRERSRLFDQLNKSIALARSSKRRAARKSRVPAWYSEFDEFVFTEAQELARDRISATEIPWHVDHMVPLRGKKASGLHCGHNVQVIPGCLNLRKHNKLWLHEPDQWIVQLEAERT